jgi:RHS repeat-associated protein
MGTDQTGNNVTGDLLFYPWGQQWPATTDCCEIHWAAFQWGGGSNLAGGSLFRTYNDSYGRWLTPDPAGLAAVDLTNPQSLNRYAYVKNNPTTLTDPSGLCTWGQAAQVALGVLECAAGVAVGAGVALAEAPTLGLSTVGALGAAGFWTAGTINIMGGLAGTPGSAEAAAAVDALANPAGLVTTIATGNLQYGEVAAAAFDVVNAGDEIMDIANSADFNSLVNASSEADVFGALVGVNDALGSQAGSSDATTVYEDFNAVTGTNPDNGVTGDFGDTYGGYYGGADDSGGGDATGDTPMYAPVESLRMPSGARTRRIIRLRRRTPGRVIRIYRPW